MFLLNGYCPLNIIWSQIKDNSVETIFGRIHFLQTATVFRLYNIKMITNCAIGLYIATTIHAISMSRIITRHPSVIKCEISGTFLSTVALLRRDLLLAPISLVC